MEYEDYPLKKEGIPFEKNIMLKLYVLLRKATF